MNPLEKQIAPDIINDSLFKLLSGFGKCKDVHTVLEIGAGSGAGSTTAFVGGMLENMNADKRFFTIEVSKQRAAMVEKRFNQIDFITVINGCATGLGGYLSDLEITEFYETKKTALNNHPLETVLQWKANEIEYIVENGIQSNVIAPMFNTHNISSIDVVLFDGSEFTGVAEFNDVMDLCEPGVIVLDDINALKNYHVHQFLMDSSRYVLAKMDLGLRNGYSVFVQKSFNQTNLWH